MSDQMRLEASIEHKVHVLVLPHVHLLDLAGPVQAFYEANSFGARYRLRYSGTGPTARTAQGLVVGELLELEEAGPADTVLVPGIDSTRLDDLEDVPIEWLRRAERAGARVTSVCSGAFVLAYAGLLDGRQCTTHWKVVERMQQLFPAARVLTNRLFVSDGRVVTSAGVASGIDLALSLIEEDHGPIVVAKVAHEMVIYMRRNGEAASQSIFLEYRTHMSENIHRVQDWLIAYPDENPSIERLAGLVGMSPRNLTRVFRRATGVSLKEFSNRVKLEVAQNLLHNPDSTVETVASRCGFNDARQLRRLWKQNFGVSPSAWKASGKVRKAS